MHKFGSDRERRRRRANALYEFEMVLCEEGISNFVYDEGKTSFRFADGLMIRLPAYAMKANDMNQWLNQLGTEYGWRAVFADEAQDMANLGHPTVASVYDPQGVGHIGIVRPGRMSNGPTLAQAGTSNVNHAHVYDFFPREDTEFFVNDRGNGGDNLPA